MLEHTSCPFFGNNISLYQAKIVSIGQLNWVALINVSAVSSENLLGGVIWLIIGHFLEAYFGMNTQFSLRVFPGEIDLERIPWKDKSYSSFLRLFCLLTENLFWCLTAKQVSVIFLNLFFNIWDTAKIFSSAGMSGFNLLSNVNAQKLSHLKISLPVIRHALVNQSKLSHRIYLFVFVKKVDWENFLLSLSIIL